MGNILQFYGHRTARALSVSPDPLKRNPSYAPIRNADLSVRTGEFRYLVWDAFSAARTSHFSDKLMELVRRYDGRLVHVQSLSGAASGTAIGTPIIQIYEVQPAESASLPAPQSAATAGPPTRPARVHLRVLRSRRRHRRSDDPQGGRRLHPGRSTMIGRSIRLAACVCLLTAWLFGPMSVQAATPTSLTMDMDSTITVGVHPTVMVRLTGPAGPVAGAAVQVQLDGRQTMRVVTDVKGEATTVLARDLEAGDYEIQAVFRGTAGPRCERELRRDTPCHTGLVHGADGARDRRSAPSSGGPRQDTVDRGGRHDQDPDPGGPPVRAGIDPASRGTQIVSSRSIDGATATVT